MPLRTRLNHRYLCLRHRGSEHRGGSGLPSTGQKKTGPAGAPATVGTRSGRLEVISVLAGRDEPDRQGGEAMTYREIMAQSALTPLKRKIPYGWDLNIYRGCAHACQYCYAIGSHRYLGSEDFAGDIHAKINIAAVLEQELKNPAWAGGVINIGGVTDSYQPAEAHCRLMPEVLRVLIKYKNPAIISTKSSLILRDYDLIDALSRLTYVNVAVTVTTVDEGLRRQLEPGAAAAEDRFSVLREFRKTRASTGLHLMPILPWLTDNPENVAGIFARARECRVDYLLPGTLYLRGATRKHFFSFLQRYYPQLAEAYGGLYRTGGAGAEYKKALYSWLNPLREQYGLSGSYMKPMRERLPGIAGKVSG